VKQPSHSVCTPGSLIAVETRGVRLRNEEGVRKGGKGRTRRTCCKGGPRTRNLLRMMGPLPVRDCHRGGRPNPRQRLNLLSGCTGTCRGRFDRNEMEKERAVGSGSTVEWLFHWITIQMLCKGIAFDLS
jgi:hypothetical protein